MIIHAAAIVGGLLWVAGNFYLWSMKQSDELLFVESIGMALVFYPALYWYVSREPKGITDCSKS